MCVCVCVCGRGGGGGGGIIHVRLLVFICVPCHTNYHLYVSCVSYILCMLLLPSVVVVLQGPAQC